MDRIQFSSLMPSWLFQYCDTVPKVINKLLLVMGGCNCFLLISALQATILPNLGISPTFLAFLLCAQNALTWFALNNHRLSSLPTLLVNDFVVGCLMGISVGGAIISFTLSQFFGQLMNCVSIKMSDYDYECQHHGSMTEIWFWAGLDFWLNTFLSVLLLYAKEDLSYMQHQSYENIGLALEELQSNFERNAVYSQPPSAYTQSPGDGTFFGSSERHQTLGNTEFPTTPTQEESNGRTYGGYGGRSGFDDDNEVAQILVV